MITKFKLYETINEGEPKKGDYVIVSVKNDDFYFTTDTIDSLNNNIHRLINIYFDTNSTTYVIDFSNNWLLNRNQIIYWSKNYEDLEPVLKSRKFNI